LRENGYKGVEESLGGKGLTFFFCSEATIQLDF